MIAGRPSNFDFPPYMTVDGDLGGFIVRNPITRKRKRFTSEQDARDTAELLAEWVAKERQARLLDAGHPLVAGLIDKWLADRMPFMPWDDGTQYAVTCKLKRIGRSFGDRVVARTDCLFLGNWLRSFCKTADQWNKWRYVLVLLWDYAVSKKLADSNEAAKSARDGTVARNASSSNRNLQHAACALPQWPSLCHPRQNLRRQRYGVHQDRSDGTA